MLWFSTGKARALMLVNKKMRNAVAILRIINLAAVQGMYGGGRFLISPLCFSLAAQKQAMTASTNQHVNPTAPRQQTYQRKEEKVGVLQAIELVHFDMHSVSYSIYQN